MVFQLTLAVVVLYSFLEPAPCAVSVGIFVSYAAIFEIEAGSLTCSDLLNIVAEEGIAAGSPLRGTS